MSAARINAATVCLAFLAGCSSGGSASSNDPAPVPAAETVVLTTATMGTGAGRITGEHVDCSAECDVGLAAGTTETLSAVAQPGSSFGGWGGACSGIGTCTVTMTGDRLVTATFDLGAGSPQPGDPLLTVATTGAGSVAGPGISCGGDCSQSYAPGTAVTLTALPDPGASFDGWSGACAGIVPCDLTMDSDRAVTAAFTPAAARSCDAVEVLCVDDTPSADQEFDTIQDAVSAAGAGDTVLVFAGDYAGFRVSASGTAAEPISVVAAEGGVNIVSPEPGSSDGIRIQNADHVVVDGFHVERAAGAFSLGISARGASPDAPMVGVIIRNNTVRNSSTTNIYASELRDSLIEGNTVSGAVAQHGIYMANAGTDDTTIRGNSASDNGLNGIHFNGDASVGGDGVQTGLLVENNILFGNGQSALNMDGVRDSTVRNNVAFDNTRHALRGYAIDASSGPSGLTIVNNTFVNNGSWGVKLTEDDGGHTIFNNVMINGSGAIVVSNTLFFSDFNVTDNRFSLNGESTVIDLPQWSSAAHGANTQNSNATTEFVDASNGDFRLTSGALALDAGVPAANSRSAPVADREGRSRPQRNAFDAGALELP